jgi:hypothetical protein
MLFSENFQVFYTNFFWATAIGFSLLFFIYCKFREKGTIRSTLRILISFILAAIFFFLPAYLVNVLGRSGPMIPTGTYYSTILSRDPQNTAEEIKDKFNSDIFKTTVRNEAKDTYRISISLVAATSVDGVLKYDSRLGDSLTSYLSENYPRAKLPTDTFVLNASIGVAPLTTIDILTGYSPFFEGSIIYVGVLFLFFVYFLLFLRKVHARKDVQL